MMPGALRLPAPRELLPSRPIGEFESCRSSWLSLPSPFNLYCEFLSLRAFSRFAREWLFYIGSVRVRRRSRQFVIHARVGRSSYKLESFQMYAGPAKRRICARLTV